MNTVRRAVAFVRVLQATVYHLPAHTPLNPLLKNWCANAVAARHPYTCLSHSSEMPWLYLKTSSLPFHRLLREELPSPPSGLDLKPRSFCQRRSSFQPIGQPLSIALREQEYLSLPAWCDTLDKWSLTFSTLLATGSPPSISREACAAL